MAVYTVLTHADIEELIQPFGIGPLLEFQGVADGIENTNYFITTDQSAIASEMSTSDRGEFVLTLYETVSEQDLSFYAQLTAHLSAKGLPVPCPLTQADGMAIAHFDGKPVTLTPKASGQHPDLPTPKQCQIIGNTLAQIHLACLEAGFKHEGIRSLDWLKQLSTTLMPSLTQQDKDLLQHLETFGNKVEDFGDLPQAVIHGDLFRDNTLFDGDTLTGIIDFNSAGDGFLALDLAIVINDWCSDALGKLDEKLALALWEAYQAVRPFHQQELELWSEFLQVAAIRFWLSRLANQLQSSWAKHPHPREKRRCF